jgi:hypothetical protein
VADARQRAQEATFQRLGPLLRDDGTRFLDTLLAPDPDCEMTRLVWLRPAAVANSPCNPGESGQASLFVHCRCRALGLGGTQSPLAQALGPASMQVQCPSAHARARGAALSDSGGLPVPISGRRHRRSHRDV